MNKRVLVLDPADSTGWCFVDIIDGIAHIKEWGFVDIESCEYSGDEYLLFIEAIQNLISQFEPDVIAHEDYFFSKFASQGANKNCAYRAMIQMIAREHGLHYEVLNISLWKKFVNGRTTPTKLQKSVWGKEPAKKLMTQESLWKQWNIRFPNHSISKKTGKPIKFRYDIVDAVAMAIFYVTIFCRVQQIQYDIQQIDDVKFKKIPKGTYVYEEETNE
jgi:Holliday junction resolvasome RuvABC endonuclease subunit